MINKIILFLCFISHSFAIFAVEINRFHEYISNKVSYRADWDNCPSKTTGKIIIELLAEFEKNKSLVEVKKFILFNKIEEKYFFSDYKIDYNILAKSLDFKFKCSNPIAKMKVYTTGHDQSYSVILTESGDLLDPQYEVLLRSENKLKGDLPLLVVNFELIQSRLQVFEIVDFIKTLTPVIYHQISEIIINESKEMTLILSFKNRPSSVFLGDTDWKLKIEQLMKIYNYMQTNNRIPSIVNLSNSKKIVVKFTDTI
jgi:hypothetical protein